MEMAELKRTLRAERQKRGWCIEALALELNVGRSTVAGWEVTTRWPSAPMLARWARALGYEIELREASDG